jgi:transglutaminase-like putative cysteine protease
MVEYQITHKTEYIYQEPIGLCQNIARLTPRTFDGQTCLQTEMNIDPKPDVYNQYNDFFGNPVTYYAIEQDHKKLTVTVHSRVQIKKKLLDREAMPKISWEDAISQLTANTAGNIDILQFLPQTPMTKISPEIKDYALASFSPGRSLFESVYDLMQRIYRDFEFKSGLTTVATPVDVVLHLRKGVCQDFAHLAIACLRAMGLPARYMSGYIETNPQPGKEKLVGADASHAWFSVFIPGKGWVDFDPTNNQVPTFQHITVAWGRDYADIAPLKGVIHSSRPHKLSVSVTVKRVVG